MESRYSRYYAGCVFLYGVLAAFDYFFYSVNYGEAANLIAEDLASWLLDEVLSLGSGGDIEETGLILEDWVTRIRSRVAEPDEAINQEVSLPYLCIHWKLQILEEFDRLVRSIDSKEVQQKYLANSGLFKALIARLQRETLVLKNRMDIAGEQTGTFHTTADALINQLAYEWNKAVEELSGQLE